MNSPVYGTEFVNGSVLIVEDSALNQQLVSTMLEIMGITRIETAEDGLEGLERLKTFSPDIIILDVMMPRMDGITFLQHLRANPAHAEIPVLVATALDEASERAAAFDAGASDYVVKPIDRREFMARVSVHLRSRLLIARLRRYQDRLGRDLAAAQAMQEGLLPTAAEIAHVEAAYGMRLNSVFRSSSELGGDLWGLIPVDKHRFGLYLVDFSGHGIAAAINTFRLHVLLGKKGDVAGDPAALLGRINQALLGVLQRGQFATMIYAVFDSSRHTMTFASASAPAPALRGPDGAARLLAINSHPLGVIAEAAYHNTEVPFQPGSGLLLYSDGLTEAIDGNGNFLGEKTALWIAEMTSGDLLSEIEVLLFRGCAFSDDLSAVWITAR
ncbi:MAG: fused response regulator/phosphatase [Phaeospirillum sp.]|nr:fused response regulator/phosphatase [Phaeospirillum sp.]